MIGSVGKLQRPDPPAGFLKAAFPVQRLCPGIVRHNFQVNLSITDLLRQFRQIMDHGGTDAQTPVFPVQGNGQGGTVADFPLVSDPADAAVSRQLAVHDSDHHDLARIIQDTAQDFPLLFLRIIYFIRIPDRTMRNHVR